SFARQASARAVEGPNDTIASRCVEYDVLSFPLKSVDRPLIRRTLVPRSRRSIVLFAILLLALTAVGLRASSGSSKPAQAKAEDTVTDYFGTKVADPYRWMEGGGENARLMEFLKSQNTYTRSILDSLKGRDA